ncbi:hypothetical protein HTT03_15685 [Sulfitobacter sp. S0837]|uniref:hypothetical protein n=1 Tax=Sulfitobacter maritimus TaxID=2741719 RepID=UPI001582C701|nr:hypothetical protein [Sulfitobacter maritimus]NUH66723.1 hypothetical protein [Sulfitobacter maritimus]
MSNSIDPARQPQDATRKYQFIFMAIGIAIIAGGLWWLYEVERPYHPVLQGNDLHMQQISDS